jgi:AraC-like DNA-binding protein
MTHSARASAAHRRGSGEAAIEQARQAFPNISVALPSDRIHRSLSSRRIEGHAISHLLTPQAAVEASGPKATQAGLGGRLKLMWQCKGTMQYEDANRSFTLRPGETLIVAMACSYRLHMGEDYEGLVLVFDPASRRSWQEAACNEIGKPIAPSGPLAAAAAGAAALLRHELRSPADSQTVESLVDIALLSLGARPAPSPELPLPALMLRARLMIAQNIADQDYGPRQLARDLGLSRRSLYSSFDRMGLKPADFIKRQRLERARDEILGQPNVGITTIALRNGFSDGAHFSHTFKAHYGVPPRDLRTMKALT